MHLPQKYLENRKLETLVENRNTYCLNKAQINVYETHQKAEKVYLKFNDFVLASMIEGKKVMHLDNKPNFNFLPGESVILPANKIMMIDFPEADLKKPTRCLAMTISEEFICSVIDLMNESLAKDNIYWENVNYNFHFTNDPPIFRILQRLLYLLGENHPLKDIFLDNLIQELIVRILQINKKEELASNNFSCVRDKKLIEVVDFINSNLHRQITAEELSNIACTSKGNFFKIFKKSLGTSPFDFINNQKIRKAESLLKNPNVKIKEVYGECGFDNPSYFNRVFKKHTNQTPKEFRNKYIFK